MLHLFRWSWTDWMNTPAEVRTLAIAYAGKLPKDAEEARKKAEREAEIQNKLRAYSGNSR